MDFGRRSVRRAAGWSTVAVIAGAAVAWMAFMTTASTIASSPYFCGICHEDKAEVRAWERSPHNEVGCLACHSAPGPGGFVQAKLQLGTFFFKHVTGLYNEPVKSGGRLIQKIPSTTCEGCHTDKRTATPTKGVLINHEIHKRKGVACTECHNRVSHPGLPGYLDNMKMKQCFRCHGFEKTARAPGKCETCHTDVFDLMPKSHKTQTWEPRDHPIRALKDKKYCDSCHPRGFCVSCHRLPMPHPAGWVRTGKDHVKVGKRSPELCRRCHTGGDFCSSCHHKGYVARRGPWVGQHFKIVRTKGVYPCFQCHRPVYCSFCHVRGMKPPT